MIYSDIFTRYKESMR